MDDEWFVQTEEIAHPGLRAFVERCRQAAPRWAELGVGSDDTQAWVYDSMGPEPWVMLSLDLEKRNRFLGTLRLDADVRGIRGGWSPAALNWDEGVPALEAEVDVRPPDGIQTSADRIETLSDDAIAWFEGHIIRRRDM